MDHVGSVTLGGCYKRLVCKQAANCSKQIEWVEVMDYMILEQDNARIIFSVSFSVAYECNYLPLSVTGDSFHISCVLFW